MMMKPTTEEINKSLDVFGDYSIGKQNNKLTIKLCQKEREREDGFYGKDQNILVILLQIG